MGAWGPGNFENDAAADWLIGFKERKSLDRLKAPLEKGLRDKTGDDWDEALVAAEILSLIRGHPSKDCPDDLKIWAQQNQVHPPVELMVLVRRFLAYVIECAQTPEFKSGFKDTHEAVAYLAAQKKFLKRIKFNFKKLPKVAGQPDSPKPRKEPWIFMGYVKIRKDGYGGSMGRDGERLSLPELPEVVPLKPRKDSRISLELHLDFFFTPEEVEQLTRVIKRNGQHRLHLVRLSGGIYFKNKDLQRFLENIASGIEYLDLLVSSIDLAPLAKAERLSKLALHLQNKAKGSDLAYLEGMGELEVLIISQIKTLPCGDIFSGNSKLKHLVIGAEALENNRLPELPKSLEELSLSVNQTDHQTDFSSLTRLPNLRRLAFSAKYFQPLPVAGFERLESAGIDTAMEDVSFLHAAKKLLDLELPPLLPSLDFLVGLNELRRLRIGGGYKLDLVVEDLTPLEKLPKLRTFHLHHSSKITKLPRLVHLERFEYYGMPQLELAEIARFPALKEFSNLSPNLSGGILEKLKAINPRVEWVDSGLYWREAEGSRYNTYFM